MSRQIPTSWVLLACLLVPRITLAEIAPAARTVVDRYVEATGGASALAAQQALRSKGRINTMEFHGTFEEWYSAAMAWWAATTTPATSATACSSDSR